MSALLKACDERGGERKACGEILSSSMWDLFSLLTVFRVYGALGSCDSAGPETTFLI